MNLKKLSALPTARLNLRSLDDTFALTQAQAWSTERESDVQDVKYGTYAVA